MKNIIFFIVYLASHSGFSQDATEFQAKAKEKYKEGKAKEALALYNKALALSPSNHEYYLERSDVYFDLNKFEEGFMDLNKAITSNPSFIPAYIKRANIYYLMKEFDKSIIDYSTAYDLSETDSLKNIILVQRSGSKAARMDHFGAISDCRMALAIDSLSVGAWNNLALSLDEAGEKEEVMIILRKIISIDPNLFYPYVNMGYKLSLIGQFQESLPFFNKALELNPDEPYTYNNRGYSKLMLSDINGALKDINKSIKLNPVNAFAYRNRGLAYHAQGKSNKACEEWETALKLGFAISYGNEVHDLIKSNCLK